MFTEKAHPVSNELLSYIDSLRARKGSRFYDVDPFVEVFEMGDNVYSLLGESGDGHGYLWNHLIVGPEKALLVDSCFGIGNLKGLVNEISGGKEVILVNTWPHIQRSLGNAQFGSVYCHKLAVPVMEGVKKPENLEKLFDENGEGIWVVCKRSDAIQWRDYEIIGCEDGHCFDLGGGYEVELIWMPGVSPSGVCYLDKQSRILFTASWQSTGISIGAIPRVMKEPHANAYATVPAFLEHLEKLKARENEFDMVFPCNDALEMDKSVIDDYIYICQEALEESDGKLPSQTDTSQMLPISRIEKGLASMAYNKKSLISCGDDEFRMNYPDMHS